MKREKFHSIITTSYGERKVGEKTLDLPLLKKKKYNKKISFRSFRRKGRSMRYKIILWLIILKETVAAEEVG